jgi:hypothetical protein
VNRYACASLGLSLCLAVFGASASAATSSATLTGTVTTTGQASRLCLVGSPKVQIGSAVNIATVSGETINIASLADSQTLSTKATSFDIDFNAVCNFAHAVQLSSDRGGLWRLTTGQVSAEFAEGVPYHATLLWAGQTSTLEATAVSVTPTTDVVHVNAPAGGTLVVQVRIDPGATGKGMGLPLAAGVYRDTITVTLGPQ